MSDEPTSSYVANAIHRFSFAYKFIWRWKDAVLYGRMHPVLGTLLVGATLYALSLLYSFYRYVIKKRELVYKDKHVFITGGSTGLGYSLAEKLYKQGASVTIIARNKERLEQAQNEIQKSETGKIQYFSFDMNNPDPKDVDKLIEDAESTFGPIDYLFCNAGISLPGMFLNSDVDNYEKQITLNYLGYVKISQPIARKMAVRKQGTIVYVSSVLGTMSIPGYSAYTPSKHAIKALADCVQLELKPYNIKVHLYLPGTIDSPGYEEENKMKPEVTKRIEGNADMCTPSQAADILLNGMKRGDYIISTETVFELIFPTSIGLTKRNNLLYQVTIAPVSVLINAIFYFICWKEVRSYRSYNG